MHVTQDSLRFRFVDFVYKSILSTVAWQLEALQPGAISPFRPRTLPGWLGCEDIPLRHALFLPRAWWGDKGGCQVMRPRGEGEGGCRGADGRCKVLVFVFESRSPEFFATPCSWPGLALCLWVCLNSSVMLGDLRERESQWNQICHCGWQLMLAQG